PVLIRAARAARPRPVDRTNPLLSSAPVSGRGVLMSVASFAGRRLLIFVAAVAAFLVLGIGTAAAAPPHSHAGQPDFGPNVLVFDPSMPTSQIQAAVDAVAAQQVPNQFGPQRYALLFKPGTYGTAAQPLNFQVGYYTSVAGLGRSPGDVTVNGSIYVHNQCGA